MSTRPSIVALLLTALVLVAAPAAVAQDEGDPIIKMDGSYDIELDLGMMVEDLLPRLLSAMAEEDPEEAEAVRRVLDLMGIGALDRLIAESEQSRDHSVTEFEITLDPEHAETMIYRMLTAPNGSCEFARYVDRDDVVMFMALHNVRSYLELVLDFLARPELAEMLGDMPVNADGDLALGEFVPRRDLLPLLSGELDFFFLEGPDDMPLNPMTAPYFLVLGSSDGFALRDKILEIAAMSGTDLSGMLDAADPEMIGEFEFKALPFGGAVAVSEDFLVLGMAPDVMRGVLEKKRGDLKVPDGIEYVYMDGAKYGAYLESMMGMAAMMDPDEASETYWLMEIYGVMFDHIEYEEVLYRSRKDGMEGTLEVSGPVMSGMYKMLPALLDKLPEIMAMQKLKQQKEDAGSAYRGAIGAMDQAMMAYAVDHGGTYPEDPAQLYQDGYLEEWPFLNRLPAGEYGDWDYSYHVYRDENDTVNGYIFFLYGGGEGTGYDVYSAENVAAEGPFAIGGDGAPDGVVGFCYDGVAIPMVDEFLGR